MLRLNHGTSFCMNQDSFLFFLSIDPINPQIQILSLSSLFLIVGETGRYIGYIGYIGDKVDRQKSRVCNSISHNAGRSVSPKMLTNAKKS